MNDPCDDELEDDPILEATIDRVLARHRGVIPAAMHADFRRLLRVALATRPVAQEILRRLHRRASIASAPATQSSTRFRA